MIEIIENPWSDDFIKSYSTAFHPDEDLDHIEEIREAVLALLLGLY